MENKLIPKVIRNTGWESLLLPLFSDTRWISLRKSLIDNRQKIAPHPSNLFDAFSFFEPTDLKCVFVGLSPYCNVKNGKRVATGIPFANNIEGYEGIKASPSLDIFVQAIDEYDITLGYKHDNPFDFTLESICKQGVLFINVYWTVEINNYDARQHKDSWSWFTESMLEIFNKEFNAISYVFCGRDAQDFGMLINEDNNKVINVPHPAATSRKHKELGMMTKVPKQLNFVYQNPFKQVNDYLQMLNGDSNTIQWRE